MTYATPSPSTRCSAGTAAGEDIAAKLPLLSTYLGHVDPAATYWYLSAAPELLGLAAERLERSGDARATLDVAFFDRHRRARPTAARRTRTEGRPVSALAPTLQAFFTERLIGQRQASPHTIAAYRDTFGCCSHSRRSARASSRMRSTSRTSTPTRSARSLITSSSDARQRPQDPQRPAGGDPLALPLRRARHPEHAATIARVLAIPTKRHDRAIVCYLDEPETTALLAAPDQTRWIGRRDHALMTLAIQTGLRVSELVALRCQDAQLTGAPHIQATGKGRKQRITPLTSQTTDVLRRWTKERAGNPDQPLLPTSGGRALSRDAVALLVSRHARSASHNCPTLATKTVSPHVLRHTAAMNLLRAGVDTSVIALWLGHESTEATQIYMHADMAIKERALARTTPNGVKPGRYQPADPLLAFLERL